MQYKPCMTVAFRMVNFRWIFTFYNLVILRELSKCQHTVKILFFSILFQYEARARLERLFGSSSISSADLFEDQKKQPAGTLFNWVRNCSMLWDAFQYSASSHGIRKLLLYSAKSMPSAICINIANRSSKQDSCSLFFFQKVHLLDKKLHVFSSVTSVSQYNFCDMLLFLCMKTKKEDLNPYINLL